MRNKIIFLSVFCILVLSFFTNTNSAYALSTVPPNINPLDYTFDDGNNPQVMTITGKVKGGYKEEFCTVEQDSQQIFEFALTSLGYEILGTSLSGNPIITVISPEGQDGQCFVVGNGGEIEWQYNIGPTDINISSLAAGDYILRITAVNENSSSSQKNVSFTVNRPAPTCTDPGAANYGGALPCTYTGTIMVTSRDQNGNPLDTNWNITGQENINGTGADVPYPNKPTGSYNISPAVLSGYTGPTITNGQMQTLTANGTITFNLVYTINGYGNSCNSSPNVCGQTNTGTIDGNGNCTASPPPDSQCPAPTADITADNGSVAHNGETTIRWTSQNTSSCTVTNNRNSTTWSGTSGNNLSGKLKSNQSPYVWTASCTGTNGSQVSDSVTVTVGAEPTPVNGVCSSPQLHYSCSAGNLGDNAEYSDSYQWWCNGINGGSNAFCVENKSMPPTVDISAASTNIPYNTSTTITWTSANTASCTVTPNNWTGTSGSQNTGNLTSNRTYTATCTGANGSQVSDSVTVTVNMPAVPTVGLTCNGNSGSCSIAYNSSANLAWTPSGSYISSCTASGNWSGSKSTSGGSESTGNLSSSKTYSIYCSNPGGDGPTTSVTVNVGAGPSMNYLRCNGVNTPGTCNISYNGTAAITWSSSNTTICSLVATNAATGATISDDAVSPSGSRNDGSITANRNYSIECWDANTGVHAPALSLPLRVVVNGPSVDIKARQHGSGGYSNGPISVAWNSTVDLDWTSSSATSCTASGDWSGSQSTGGNTQTSPLTQVKQYSYTLTCTGNGSAMDTVLVNINGPNPDDPGEVSVLHPTAAGLSDYCYTGPGAYVSWTYSDPSGSPQSAYEIEIDDSGSFGNPEVDSGKVTSTGTSYSSGAGYLAFGTTYKARVRVWNGYDQVSGWAVSSSFKTPNFAYPDVDFSWTPVPPQVKKIAQFNDLTVFYDGNPNGWLWSWVFGDGGNSSSQNPTHTYLTPGSYQVTLTATDNANQVCSETKIVNVQRQIPKWLEIAPR